MTARSPRVPVLLRQLRAVDLQICRQFNRLNRLVWASRLFGLVSRLGDGPFWYANMLAMIAVHRTQGVVAVAHMLLVGIVCLMLYKWVKEATMRIRPFERHAGILKNVEPLDRYSFPSGHTLHAVAFNYVAILHFPLWGAALIGFTLLVAASRLVLGLHYPSDVIGGAAIGATVATASLPLLST